MKLGLCSLQTKSYDNRSLRCIPVTGSCDLRCRFPQSAGGQPVSEGMLNEVGKKVLLKLLLVISVTIGALVTLPNLYSQDTQNNKGKPDPSLVLPQDVN